MEIRQHVRMVRIVLMCALIFVISGLHQGVTAGKPEMIPAVEELSIQEGEELKIQCQGDGTIKFSRQKLTVGQSHHRIDNNGFDTYTFIISRASRTDTGWYACAEDDIEIENDEQTIDHHSENIRWIYVYVNSIEPFAVMESFLQDIKTPVGSNAVIPCRPTSPTLNVIIEVNDEDTPLPENSKYDPKIGLTILEPGQDRSGEVYTCKVEGIDREHWPSYYLDITDSKPLKNPIINQNTLRHVVWGTEMILECTIIVSANSPVTLDWTAPDSVSPERLQRYKQQLFRKDTWKLELGVKNVQETDAGEYVCSARDSNGRKTRASTVIKIWDPAYTYINISMDSGKFSISLPKGEIARWKVHIDSYPENFGWHWFKQDETEITKIGSYENDKYSHRHEGMVHFFRISQLAIEDNGNYTIHVSTSHNATTIILPLTVEVPPETRITKGLSSSSPKQSATFFCHTSGSPLPNITWSYREYPNFPSTENSALKSLSNNREEAVSEGRFHTKSHINITIDTPGDVICRTCNRINCTEAVYQISDADATGVFSINGPESVVEGDNITVSCRASRLNFTDKIEWKYPKSISDQNLDSERIYRSKHDTNATSRLDLEIFNVSMSDSGTYWCEAECKTTGKKTKNYTLNVLEAREPHITYTNMNESKIVIKHNEMTEDLILTCTADGSPIPDVTWYKDEELLAQINQYNFSPKKSTLSIKFFRESDNGRYSCLAKNRLGSDSHYIDVEIQATTGSQSNVIWISLICVLIVVIVIVITYMLIKVRREKRLRKELLDAGLTNFQDGAVGSLNPELTVDEQAELLPYDKKWEFPRELLKLGKQLGSGAFGVVMKAEARGICVEGEVTTVAVKMVRRSADPSYMKALSSELKIMIHLGRHINVVNLLGACTKTILTKRELFVIVEYCRFGNLHNYLQRHRDTFIDQIDPTTRKIDPNIGSDRLGGRTCIDNQNKSKYANFSHSVSVSSSNSVNGIQLVDFHLGQDSEGINMSPDGGILSNNSVQPGWRSNYRGDYKDQNLKPICTQDLICWAWQVSRGMEYLSARNVLHGDLAARNILLADNNIVKICDFGLAKNMYKDNNYQKKGEGPLPIKWMAIESIRDRIFSTQSDVWSFGIVLWELFTLSRTPYPGMEAEKQYDRLMEGYRMEKPDYATKEIYDLILNCWDTEPTQRPLFPELVSRIGNLLNDRVKTHYFDLNTPYMNMNNLALQNGQSDYLTMMSAPNHTYCNSPHSVVEVHTDSGYVSMNRVKQSSQNGVLTPSPVVEESHFNFPPSSPNTPIQRDSENVSESDPMLTTPSLWVKPVGFQQARTESVKNGKERNADESESAYCNVPNFFNLVNPPAASPKNPDTNPKDIKLRMDNAKEFSPAPGIGGHKDRVNESKQKTDLLEDRNGDSFSNPSYVTMSNNKLEENNEKMPYQNVYRVNKSQK